jgi:tetratricopeptide (TPR) repeat protein
MTQKQPVSRARSRRAASADSRHDTERRASHRRRVYMGLAYALPFLILIGAELTCRRNGYGGYPPLLKHIGSDGRHDWYSTYRPGVETFFYRGVGGSGGMRDFAFTTPKPPGTVRIGLFGDSAMQGFPQPLPLTNGSFLQSMLQDVWGSKQRVEVLNFGCTAVASFVSMHILEAALAHDLDLVVIMAGNNEYFGAYGVASVHRAGTSPWALQAMRWLRRFALPQWLGETLAKRAAKHGEGRQVLMERVAAVQQIGPDDRLRNAARRLATAHLARMVRDTSARGVPVIICTLPTNERDLYPIGQDIAPPLPPSELAKFEDEVKRGEAGLDSDPGGAAEVLRSAVARWGKHARAHYLLARALTKLGRDLEALHEYVLARDLDTMPWRATSATNDAARAAAAACPGARLCDMEAAFRAACPGGAIGWELVDDHVHFTQRGQALFAEVIAREMTRLPGRVHVDSLGLAPLPGWETYAEKLGRNPFDEYASLLHMKKLLDAEFMARSNPGAQARVNLRIDALRAQMSKLDLAALNEWSDSRQPHMAANRPITALVGSYHRTAGDFAGAAACFRMARECASNVSLWRLQNTVDLLRCNRHLRGPSDEDRDLCRDAIEVGELLRRFAGLSDRQGYRYLGLAYHFAGENAAAVPYLEQAVRFEGGLEAIDVVQGLAESFAETGQLERARMLLMVAQKDPEIRDTAIRLLATLAPGPADSVRTK